ncbi:MAG: 2,3-bisphosphoglycerate-independent phosphoglycerate mutase [Alphaproteobacteria bacterium]
MILRNIPKPIILCILDGWGIKEKSISNAIAMADTPFLNYLYNNFPYSCLSTSGVDVGLPEGQMGNSEVGHMSIGCGRVILQDLVRINDSISKNQLEENEDLIRFISNIKDQNKCHIMGLFSEGGVHSHQQHIIYLAQFLSRNNIKVVLHLFTDGRDTAPMNIKYNFDIINELLKDKNISLATVSGRYYGMDRDNRWDRTELAFNAIVYGKAEREENIENLINKNYSKNIFDEFIKPTIIGEYKGIKEDDAIIMVNFRSDRVRQILSALCLKEFKGFNRGNFKPIYKALGMVEYSEELSRYMPALFHNIKPKNSLPEILSQLNFKQLRIAETEKYAHVTFFFNGGEEEPYPGEERILISSPKVSTYDLMPEMSAYQITDKILETVNDGKHDIIIVNYANCDMVGHTGNLSQTIKAVETIDICLKKIHDSICDINGILIITSDHGNAEEMFSEETKLPHTAHTTNLVPFIITGKNIDKSNLMVRDGKLSDIAPTILHLMNIDKPEEMTGNSLIKLKEKIL